MFGTPYFASGYLRRSATGGRLDWSLIQPNDNNRVAGNPLPSWKPLTDKGFRPVHLPLKGVGEDSTLKSQGDSIHDHVQEGFDTSSNKKPDTCSYEELVGYKQGAATGPTVGMLSAGKTYCRTPGQPGRYSAESRPSKARAGSARGAAKQMTQLCEYKPPPSVSSLHPVFLRGTGLGFRQSLPIVVGSSHCQGDPDPSSQNPGSMPPPSLRPPQRGSACSDDFD